MARTSWLVVALALLPSPWLSLYSTMTCRRWPSSLRATFFFDVRIDGYCCWPDTPPPAGGQVHMVSRTPPSVSIRVAVTVCPTRGADGDRVTVPGSSTSVTSISTD